MKYIGDYLQEMGAVSEEQLRHALSRQKETGTLLGQLLMEMGLIRESALDLALALQGQERARHLTLAAAVRQVRELVQLTPLRPELPFICIAAGLVAGILSFPIIFYFYSGWAWQIIGVSSNLSSMLTISGATIALIAIAVGLEAFATYACIHLTATLLRSSSRLIHARRIRRALRAGDMDNTESTTSLYAQNLEQFASNVEAFLIKAPKAIASLAAFFVIIFMINTGMALLMLVLAPFTLLLPPLVAAKAQPFLRRETEMLGDTMKRIEPFFQYFRTTGGVLLQRATQRLGIHMRPHHINQANKWFYWNTSFNVRSFFNLLTLTCILIYGGWNVLEDTMSLPALFSLFLVASMILPRFNDIYESFFHIHTAGHHAVLINRQLRMATLTPQPVADKAITAFSVAIDDFRFGTTPVLRQFSQRFRAGNAYLITGESGSGKSTLAKLMAGILPAPDLHLSIEYSDGDGVERVLGRVAYVGQEHVFLEKLGVEGNIACQQQPDAATQAAVEAGLRRLQVNMEPRLGQQLVSVNSHFSGGEKQRMHVLQGLLAPQKIRIFDEPTASLDHQTAQQIKDVLLDVPADEIRLIISHDHAWNIAPTNRITLHPQTGQS